MAYNYPYFNNWPSNYSQINSGYQQPAYITCSPYESVYGYNRGCGCGNCGF